MLQSTMLRFFARDKECIKVYDIGSSKDDKERLDRQDSGIELPTPKVAAWSPDGRQLALVDPGEGVQVLELLGDAEEQRPIHTLLGSAKTTHCLQWSPLGSALVTVFPAPKGSQEPNIHIWTKKQNVDVEDASGPFTCAMCFLWPKLEKDKKVVQWSPNEAVCARLCPDGVIQLLDGANLGGAPLTELTRDVLTRGAQDFEFAPLRGRNGSKVWLATFVPDVRDDMQRVTGPGEVAIWDFASGTTQLQKCMHTSVASGQVADIKWSPTGTAILAHCQTEVDESGQSYYGGSQLLLLSHDGQYQKDLAEVEEGATNTGTSIQAVEWCPTRDEFILIRGFQPAQATLWQWNGRSAVCMKVLLEKAHRNTIRFNHFGSLVCLAGYGNLSGGMDFFGNLGDGKCNYVRVSSCQANCTVSAEWAPDGRHFLTAVLFPRMRVDNGLTIWQALSGSKVSEVTSEELYEAQWRPEAFGSHRFADISVAEVEQASKDLNSRAGTQGAEKKQAYRPPKARGDGASTVAAMMRGEMEAPDPNTERLNARKKHTKPREEDDPEAPAGTGERDGREVRDPRETREGGRERTGSDQRHAAASEHGGGNVALPKHADPLAASSAPAQQSVPTRDPAQEYPKAAPTTGYGGYPSAAPAGQKSTPVLQHHQQPQQQQQAAAAAAQQRPSRSAVGGGGGPGVPAQESRRAAPFGQTQVQYQPPAAIQGHGEKLPCPTSGWQYVDPKGNVQGPFTLLEMQQWNTMGYFKPGLRMRCDPDDEFVKFAELFPHPMIPFTSYPKRPVRGSDANFGHRNMF